MGLIKVFVIDLMCLQFVDILFLNIGIFYGMYGFFIGKVKYSDVFEEMVILIKVIYLNDGYYVKEKELNEIVNKVLFIDFD